MKSYRERGGPGEMELVYDAGAGTATRTNNTPSVAVALNGRKFLLPFNLAVAFSLDLQQAIDKVAAVKERGEDIL